MRADVSRDKVDIFRRKIVVNTEERALQLLDRSIDGLSMIEISGTDLRVTVERSPEERDRTLICLCLLIRENIHPFLGTV